MPNPYPIPRAPLSPADLAGQRRRHDYDLPRLATSHGASTSDPGAAERKHRLAEWRAMHDADVTRLQADLAVHDGLLGCEGWLGSLPADFTDDDREALGLPTTDYGTLAGPAEGHALKEPREAVTWRRVVGGIIVLGFAAALVWGLVRAWLP